MSQNDMKPFTQEDCEHPWVVRTHYSSNSDQAWDHLKKLVESPQHDSLSGMDFLANVHFVEHEPFANLSAIEIVRALPDGYPGFVIFLADEQTFSNQEHPLIVVGFASRSDDPQSIDRNPSQTPSEDIKIFRAIPSTLQSIENNLSIANMDFDDFANAVESDGVFRGFKS